MKTKLYRKRLKNRFLAVVLLAGTCNCLVAQDVPPSSDQSLTTGENIVKNYEVIQSPSRMIIGISCRTSNSPEAGPKDIAQLWGRFFSEGISGKIPNKISNEVIGLYCDYEGDYTQPYSLVIGCQVSSFDEVPDGMMAKTIPASSFAVFRAVGEHPKSLIETWAKIWQSALERTYTGDCEIYGDKFSGSPQEVEVHIAIKESHVRCAKKDEMAWINQCYDEVEFVHSNFDREVIAIAEVKDQMAGLGRLVTIEDGNLELGGMYVFEAYRGQGIARKIVDFLLGHALPSQTIYCIPFEHLTPFYMQCGFTQCSNHGEVSKEILEKYLWCQQKYAQPTALLVLQK